MPPDHVGSAPHGLLVAVACDQFFLLDYKIICNYFCLSATLNLEVFIICDYIVKATAK